ELSGDALRIGGGVALPPGLRSEGRRDRGVRLERQEARLRARKAAGFDIGGHADPAQPPTHLCFCDAFLERVPPGAFHRLAHMPIELADVVAPPAGSFIGKLVRLDEITAADFLARHIKPTGTFLYQLLDQERSFRPARSTIGIDRTRIGVDALYRDI